MKKNWKKFFFQLHQNLHVLPTALSEKIPINDLLNKIKRLLYVRVKVSWHFRLENYFLNRSFRPCRGKLSNEHDQRKFSLYPSFELIPFVVRTKTNCEREKRLNLNKRRNKICSFFHLLCLMNIKMQTSLGKFKCNLNQTPMPLLFCKPLNWKARLSHAEETLANQHDPRMS